MNHQVVTRLAVADSQALFHPIRGRDYGGGFRQPTTHGTAIPAEPACISGFMSVNGEPPTYQVGMRHHYARDTGGEVAVSVLAEGEGGRLDGSNSPLQTNT